MTLFPSPHPNSITPSLGQKIKLGNCLITDQVNKNKNKSKNSIIESQLQISWSSKMNSMAESLKGDCIQYFGRYFMTEILIYICIQVSPSKIYSLNYQSKELIKVEPVNQAGLELPRRQMQSPQHLSSKQPYCLLIPGPRDSWQTVAPDEPFRFLNSHSPCFLGLIKIEA